MVDVKDRTLSTPRKIIQRISVCQLCGISHDSKHLVRIFGNKGSQNNLNSPIFRASSVTVLEELSSLLI